MTAPVTTPGARPQVELFTDGACLGNPGPGGWAYILRHPRSGRIREASGGRPRTTNNRMEMTAVIEGLRSLDRPCSVHLFSDSEYVVKGLREWMDGWKAKDWKRGRKPVKNLDLWLTLDELRETHNISPQWVRGHNNHPQNERCDQLASAAAQQAAKGGEDHGEDDLGDVDPES